MARRRRRQHATSPTGCGRSSGPSSPEQTGLDRYREAVTPIRTLAAGRRLARDRRSSPAPRRRASGATTCCGATACRSARNDAYFHKDIGFYVFDLPWLHYLVDFAMAVTVVALIAAAVVHYLYGGIRLQTTHDRLSGAAQAQLSVLLGVFVLAKAADYWLDRFDLVTRAAGLITGMTYTDDHAVLPAKNILMGIAVICAVLFFLNVWRRTWLLPSVGLALLALSAILLGLIWPGIVQQFQVKPSEADKEAPYIATNIEATRGGVRPRRRATSSSTRSNAVGRRPAQLARWPARPSSTPLVDPQLVRQTFEQNQQVRAYYSVADVLDVDRYTIEGIDRALVLGVRELDQSGIARRRPELVEPAHRLHARQRRHRGVRQPARRPTTRPSATDDPVGRGPADRARTPQAQHALGGYETPGLLRRAEPGLLDRRQAAGRLRRRARPGRGRRRRPRTPRPTTTYDGKGGVPVGSLFHQLLYAVKFGEPNFLLSGRVNANSKVLYNRNPRRAGGEGRAVADHRRRPLPGGRRRPDRVDRSTATRPPTGTRSAQRESFETMTDDSLQTTTTELRTLPTDEINYMRNAVKATVDAYDGTVTLYAWDESDPILPGLAQRLPRHGQGQVARSRRTLLEHLRYPEDLFKVQRYQFARYHVTDAERLLPGQQPLGRCRTDPNSAPAAAAAVPAVRRTSRPDRRPATTTFSLTSVFTPERQEQPRGLRVGRLRRDRPDRLRPDAGAPAARPDAPPGPGQIANDVRVRRRGAPDQLQPFSSATRTPIFGNLLTLPVSDGLIYVSRSTPRAPARRRATRSCSTCWCRTAARSASARPSAARCATPSTSPARRRSRRTTGGGKGAAADRHHQRADPGAADSADAAFARADAALAKQDLATYAKQVEQRAARSSNEAMRLAGERDQAEQRPGPGPPAQRRRGPAGAVGVATPRPPRIWALRAAIA